MNNLIEPKRAKLNELCRQHRVRRLHLFGSAVQGRFDPARSDLDFLVEFDPMTPSEYAAAFFGLREQLAALFGTPIDLVTTSSLQNPFFKASVERTRELLYAA